MTDPASRQPSGLPQFRGANVPPPRTGRRWLPVVGDIALAVWLLVLDVIGAVAAFLLGIDYTGWKPFDPGADNSDIALTPNWLYVGIAGGVMLLTAPLLYLLRAVISTGMQVLAGSVVVVIAVGGAQIDQDRATRPSASTTSDAAPKGR
ncbi:hypothetical protein J7E88_10600 [Streptomyces sp. ISL-10]|uniref:DUF6234 family protein n=1 Tax=Streptomyces sp. ISL-10 TaxID=2819172 RepID=UPI001BE54E34|nr:DUF6234 family protein [Streptomyces sp. ISL-10]MBT2365750.1 hypothetical protein [Streptomyces sp. ISL-10]